MNTRLRIRGIYATALTRLALDWDYSIVQPSNAIAERLGLEENELPFDISIDDKEDLQGIEIQGDSESVFRLLLLLREQLFDASLIDLREHEKSDGTVIAKIEFPASSKQSLDEIRNSVMPTLMRHHRLRVIDSELLDNAEMHLLRHPHDKERLERQLFLESIFLPLEKHGEVKMEHIRPSGKPMRPRNGVLIRAKADQIVFKRTFSDEGRYDGLDLAIKKGDYGLTEIQEGKWYVKHMYFRRNGEPIGEYYNINSPVELYPYGARYLDLEVDIIRRAGESPFLIDREKLALLTQDGCITKALEAKAMEVAEHLMLSIAG